MSVEVSQNVNTITENADIEVALRSLKECQTLHNANCLACSQAQNCAQKMEFEEMTLNNLARQQTTLKQCQEERGFVSCLNCAEMLECKVRNDYVRAVHLSMNKGNGGSFEF